MPSAMPVVPNVQPDGCEQGETIRKHEEHVAEKRQFVLHCESTRYFV